MVRRAFETALSYRPFSLDTMTDKSIPKVNPVYVSKRSIPACISLLIRYFLKKEFKFYCYTYVKNQFAG